MTKLEKFLTLIVILCVGLFGFYAMTHTQSTQSLGDGRSIYQIRTIPTNSSSTVSTGSTLIVATNTARAYVAIVNDSANTVYLGIGTNAVLGKGIRLNANGGSFEMTPDGIFTGPIYGISSSASAITYLEGQ